MRKVECRRAGLIRNACVSLDGRALWGVNLSSVASDADLVDRCLRREDEAWRELVTRYRRLIYSIPGAYRVADPDEIFQSVCLKLYEHLRSLRNRASLAAWISTTTRRECLAALRRERRVTSIEERSEEEFPEDPPDVVQRLFEIECEHALHLALERLDAVCRTLLHALYVEEPTPSYKEISERIGRPVGSLGPTRGRCLDKLRGHYTELEGRVPDDVSDDAEAPPQR